MPTKRKLYLTPAMRQRITRQQARLARLYEQHGSESEIPNLAQMEYEQDCAGYLERALNTIERQERHIVQLRDMWEHTMRESDMTLLLIYCKERGLRVPATTSDAPMDFIYWRNRWLTELNEHMQREEATHA